MDGGGDHHALATILAREGAGPNRNGRRRMDNLPREWKWPPESVAGDVLRYLREYKRYSGVVPRATTWQLLMRGTRDSRGDDIGAAFQCEVCGENRRVGACHGVLVDAAIREGRASCEMVKGA